MRTAERLRASARTQPKAYWRLFHQQEVRMPLRLERTLARKAAG